MMQLRIFYRMQNDNIAAARKVRRPVCLLAYHLMATMYESLEPEICYGDR
jgi:hypothetical protein